MSAVSQGGCTKRILPNHATYAPLLAARTHPSVTAGSGGMPRARLSACVPWCLGTVPSGCSLVISRRTICGAHGQKQCHVNGGELERIQFLLGHASVLMTERYLGCKQNLEEPVNDRFGVSVF